jgi:hypothetical protein
VIRQNVPLGRILGIPIGLDYSWFLVFVLLTWMLGSSYYPAELTLQQMDRDGVNQLPVITDSRVVGMLSREDIITFLRTVQELGA